MKASIKNLKSELKNQQDEYDSLEADNEKKEKFINEKELQRS
jgi:hypothetical protein